MFSKVLIANRGEIACRIARTLSRMGIRSVAVYSEADAGSLHVAACDEAHCIGPAQPAASYLDHARILEAARASGAQAIHPGYGFLSENAGFAEACAAAGIAFIGPAPAQMRDFGLKHTARALAEKSGVPLLPGTGLLENAADAASQAERIGYPVMLKSTAGGGGIGMQAVNDGKELAAAWETVSRLSQGNFKHGGIYLEKYVGRARHVEVQIFGDGKGKVLALGERDCSAQRRNQKVLEETPAPGLGPALRAALLEAAVRLGETAAYQSAGTVEFVLDADAASASLQAPGAAGPAGPSGYYFLEVNTRLQVEHGVTEEVTGIDLVEWMIRQAAGELDALESLRPEPAGHSIQARVYAENPRLDFRPSAGTLTEVSFPPGTRVDTWVEPGSEVSPFYDPLVAKIIVKGRDRAEALAALEKALADTRLYGIETNLEFLRAVAASPEFAQGRMTTRKLQGFSYASDTVDVLAPGAQTAVQDYPGRTGFWDVGVPPSGPFDPLSFRLGNRLLENPESAAGLEITVAGPTLRFNRARRAVLTGATLKAELITSEGTREVPMWAPFSIPSGGVLKLGSVTGAGMRAYLCVQAGLDTPVYMGSRSTFTLGNFGGHAGRILRAGDVLHLVPGADDAGVDDAGTNDAGTTDAGTNKAAAATLASPIGLAPFLRPAFTRDWEIGVLYGPHGAPDYFTAGDIGTFFATAWEVHYNSNRTGVRLIGPKPEWARPDGGEAGLHPSNIHDNAYAIGAVDFTGDMPILLGPDGPSLGGFVCPATIAQAELWKMGQLKPGDKVRFRKLSLDQARDLERRQEDLIRRLAEAPAPAPGQLAPARAPRSAGSSSSSPFAADAFGADRNVLHHIPAAGGNPEVRYRRSGDRNVLVEYGPPVLDLNLRFRVHALMERLRALGLEGVIDLTPGIRSLQIHFDGRTLPMEKLLRTLAEAEARLPAIEDMEIPARIVHMPLSWDDEATHAVIRKYMQSVRADAPWCPSNIEFIRRINGLDSAADVYRTVFDAEYLVMGLGDVYLGAPVATPLDPRHRLVTTKYNPARTWTVENVVGIGGAYLCIYGMEGPGGYQLFGRTSQVWNTYRKTGDFRDGKPWLLRFFDQIRFYPVSGKELLDFRSAFVRGRASLRIEPHVFRLKDYNRFLHDNRAEIAAFRDKQRTAFREERERWKAAGAVEADAKAGSTSIAEVTQAAGPEAGVPVDAHVSGNVWKVLVAPGQRVEAETPLLILESMKMEFTVAAPAAGKVGKVLAREGGLVVGGQTLLYLEENS
ncbi:MAG TPA: urea carboxylase [Fibrobacteria bacterium]|nr:urea carboxylase [Fibrobacteria bacterium]